ncbi:hypothetical protein ACFWQL_22080 [Amycolatopsis thermoflava]|uniref:hypothetical protein n=1 Tax=Amycolatopsis thermoflava TaxID=84480 RepID=UPI003659CE24
MSTPHLSSPPVAGGFGFPMGFASCIPATLVTVAAGATRGPALSLALLVVVIGVATLTTAVAAVGTATFAWALHEGFVLGHHGDLILTGRAWQSLAVLPYRLIGTMWWTSVDRR